MSSQTPDAAALPQKHLVIPDPIALRYLGEDPIVRIDKHRTVLEGYELYIIEQWVCARRTPSTVITTYTGDPNSKIFVGVISVPQDEAAWSFRLRTFFAALDQYHSRPRETRLGDLITTNLSSFPSALTAILVPDGDLQRYQKIFFVNENLKRMGCSGRAGLTLNEPAPATQSKFYSLYRVHERTNVSEGVLELVRMCQYALIVFGQLEPIYTDGLLCDTTETAISNWWMDIGAEYYNLEPSDGILGPTTVAAILGTLMGARNRLNSYGVTVPKDAFEIESLMRAVSQFQKYAKIKRTRVLDRDTLFKLQSATAKAAANEGWAVQRAVKSTVAEIGGKRGELVMGIVSGRDKGGISEIETLDIEKFIGYAYGELPKWLWLGKQRRAIVESNHEKQTEIGSAQMAAKEQQQFMTLSNQRSTMAIPGEDLEAFTSREELRGVPSQSSMTGPFSPPGVPVEAAEKKTRFKSVAGRMSDARSGLGRIKDVVGGSRKVAKPGRDELQSEAMTSPQIPLIPGVNGSSRAYNKTPELNANNLRRDKFYEGQNLSPSNLRQDQMLDRHLSNTSNEINGTGEISAKSPDVDLTSPGSANLFQSQCQWLDEYEAINSRTARFQRRQSVCVSTPRPDRHEAFWERRMSFSAAEDAVLRWEEIAPMFEVQPESSQPGCLMELARLFCRDVCNIKQELVPWAEQKILEHGRVEERYRQGHHDLKMMHDHLVEAHKNMALESSEIFAQERSLLTENIKELETMLARLDYEIEGLTGKVEEVEDGVAIFEAHVTRLENKAEELRTQLETESWMHWLVRSITGIGTGPNILADSDRKTK
ncbi:hypothetical protein TD95_001265 [Thielaviopsis punctulata]|uniref:STB6-like N-terminal domain-containing protein n=1 Tax=Thielaviopsis punctulata TaxID=72032 RepID=A0A0F4ZB34_9PEZI|nr:hypothetical protein TD95_001265 [Thielaviopsis punctulata]